MQCGNREAMSDSAPVAYNWLEVRLRGCAASADNLRRRGLPTGAHAPVAKRERRLAERVGFVPLEYSWVNDLGLF